jgi:hypothetical protein
MGRQPEARARRGATGGLEAMPAHPTPGGPSAALHERNGRKPFGTPQVREERCQNGGCQMVKWFRIVAAVAAVVISVRQLVRAIREE